MRIISEKRLREFWESRRSRKEAGEARVALSYWRDATKAADWSSFGELRRTTFGSADMVGNCVVFDVGHTRYRLIGRVMFGRGRVYVLRIMAHEEYDATDWAGECGGHEPPPRRATRRAGPAGRR